MEFDKDRMLALCYGDPLLWREFCEMNCPGSDEEPELRVLYERHIKEGSPYLEKYGTIRP